MHAHQNSNTTLVKVKSILKKAYISSKWNSNTTLVKVKCSYRCIAFKSRSYSNTTLVKVKSHPASIFKSSIINSNTTLVKVKLLKEQEERSELDIQIQHLLKLNVKAFISKLSTNLFKYNTC